MSRNGQRAQTCVCKLKSLTWFLIEVCRLLVHGWGRWRPSLRMGDQGDGWERSTPASWRPSRRFWIWVCTVAVGKAGNITAAGVSAWVTLLGSARPEWSSGFTLSLWVCCWDEILLFLASASDSRCWFGAGSRCNVVSLKPWTLVCENYDTWGLYCFGLGQVILELVMIRSIFLESQVLNAFWSSEGSRNAHVVCIIAFSIIVSTSLTNESKHWKTGLSTMKLEPWTLLWEVEIWVCKQNGLNCWCGGLAVKGLLLFSEYWAPML